MHIDKLKEFNDFDTLLDICQQAYDLALKKQINELKMIILRQRTKHGAGSPFIAHIESCIWGIIDDLEANLPAPPTT